MKLKTRMFLNDKPIGNTWTPYGIQKAIDRLFANGAALDNSLMVLANNIVLAATIDPGYPRVENQKVVYRSSFIVDNDIPAVANLEVRDATDAIWITGRTSFSPALQSPLITTRQYTLRWEIDFEAVIGAVTENTIGSGNDEISLILSTSGFNRRVAGIVDTVYNNYHIDLWGLPNPLPASYDDSLDDRLTYADPPVAADVALRERVPANGFLDGAVVDLVNNTVSAFFRLPVIDRLTNGSRNPDRFFVNRYGLLYVNNSLLSVGHMSYRSDSVIAVDSEVSLTFSS